jgi:hypothetical protein
MPTSVKLSEKKEESMDNRKVDDIMINQSIPLFFVLFLSYVLASFFGNKTSIRLPPLHPLFV